MSEGKGTISTARRGVALLLPGMTLNASIFPPFPIETLGVDFAGLREPIQEGIPGYVARLVETLETMEYWSADRRYVLAHSFGGMMALQWLGTSGAARSRVHGLILLGTTAGPMYDRARLRVFALGKRTVRVPVETVFKVWDRTAVMHLMKRVMTGTLEAKRVDFQRLPIKSDIVVDLAGWRNTHLQAMRSFRDAMRGFDVRDLLPNISVPTIVLHGGRDSFFTEETAAELANGLPNAELRLIPDAAHLISLTHGDAVVGALEELRGAIPSSPTIPSDSLPPEQS